VLPGGAAAQPAARAWFKDSRFWVTKSSAFSPLTEAGCWFGTALLQGFVHCATDAFDPEYAAAISRDQGSDNLLSIREMPAIYRYIESSGFSAG
jgi:hypothetical protein